MSKKQISKSPKLNNRREAKNPDTKLSDLQPHRVNRLCLNFKRKPTNKSEGRLGQSKLQYYRNHGECYLIPKTNRLNWD
jgi:hypothetical protein